MKKLMLLLLLAAMVPLLGTSSAKADPNQSCYLDSGHTRTATAQFLGMSREVQVTWKDGYTCTGDPIQAYVSTVYEMVYWPGGPLSSGTHDIASRLLIDYANNDYGWINTNRDSCGTPSPCVVQETFHPDVYMPYQPNYVSAYAHYDSVLLQDCTDDFYFLVYNTDYSGSCDVGHYAPVGMMRLPITNARASRRFFAHLRARLDARSGG